VIKMVMDSGGDLPAKWVHENDICVVPVNIHFGTKDYREAMVAVIHKDAPEAAHELPRRAQSEFRTRESFVAKLSIGIAVHLGPGTVGLVA